MPFLHNLSYDTHKAYKYNVNISNLEDVIKGNWRSKSCQKLEKKSQKWSKNARHMPKYYIKVNYDIYEYNF